MNPWRRTWLWIQLLWIWIRIWGRLVSPLIHRGVTLITQLCGLYYAITGDLPRATVVLLIGLTLHSLEDW